MVQWKQSFIGRIRFGFRLIWRTARLQLLLGVVLLIAMLLPMLAMPMVMELLAAPLLMAAITGGGVLIGLLLYAWFGASWFAGMVMAMHGEGQVAVGEAVRSGWQRIPLLTNTAVVLMVCAMTVTMMMGLLAKMVHPTLALLAFVLFIWVMPRLFTMPMVAMMEDRSPIAVVRRGWQLSSGFWFSIVGNMLLLMLLLPLLQFSVLGIGYLFGSGSLGLWLMQAQGGIQQLLMNGSLPPNLGYGIFMLAMLFALLFIVLQAVAMMIMTAFCVLYYGEQRTTLDSDAAWQVAEQAPRTQWYLMLLWMVTLAVVLAVSQMQMLQQAKIVVQSSSTSQSAALRPAANASAVAPPPTVAPRRRAADHPSLAERKATLFARWQDQAYADKEVSALYHSHPDDRWLMQAQAWSWYRLNRKAEAQTLMEKACIKGAAAACLLTSGEVRR